PCSRCHAVTPPPLDGCDRIREDVRPIDDQKRTALDADVARVPKDGFDGTDEIGIGLRRVRLCDEDFFRCPIPSPSPVFICPADAKRMIQAMVVENLLQRSLQKLPAVEPVVVVAEAIDAKMLCERLLLGLDLRDAQIIET